MTETVEDKISNNEDSEQCPSNEEGIKSPTFKTEITISITPSASSEELVIRGNDNKTAINKSAYSKLHKLSKNRLSIVSLGRYEQSKKLPKAPEAKPSEPPTKGPKHFHFVQPSTKDTDKSVEKNIDQEFEEYIPCILRKSESVDTIDKIEKELSNFIMDPTKKEKKRTNSFRKLFSVSLFGKDKKKKEKNNVSSIPNSDCVDNYQNESFVRNSPQRHTVGCTNFKNQTNVNVGKIKPRNIEEDPPPEVIRQYAHMHINKFNNIRRSFECPENQEQITDTSKDETVQSIAPAHITKYIDTSSSTSSTMDSGKQHTYQNALIAQAELQQAKQGIRYISARCDSLRRETPPRAQDTYQPVNIVKPKARLPINSGRPLPNPYQYNVDQDASVKDSPKLNDIYGTVFDAIDPSRNTKATNHDSNKQQSPIPRSPRSPSFEVSKLKLPPNRDIIPLQPRIRSPLPSSKPCTEKMIATELLRNSTGGTDSSKYHDTSDHTDERTCESSPERSTSVSEAINALRTKLEANDQNLKEELDQIKHTLSNLTQNETAVHNGPVPSEQKLKDAVFCDTNSPRSTLMTSSRSSIAASPLSQHMRTSQVSSVSPVHQGKTDNPPDVRHNSIASADVELRQKNTISRNSGTRLSPSSPSKDEIRRSVEAYYWKEIKKIKEREDYEIYLSHLQFSQGGYAEDPSSSRRSRGMEDGRNRRSSSVPRNPRQLSFDLQNEQLMTSYAIPEGRSLLYNPHGNNIYGYITPRNSQFQHTPTKIPIASTNQRPNGENGTYKPIFRRGSLSGGIPQQLQTNKKVSFSNSRLPENTGVWPTKNGYTKSPPQRRLEKTANILEDDVFLPPPPQQINVQYQMNYGKPMKNNYSSDNESNYGSCQIGYGHNRGQNQCRSFNYNSDSEAIYGPRQRRYKTLSHQELENLRNSQTNGIRSTDKSAPRLTRHESIQLPEPNYGYGSHYGMNRGYPQSISPQNRVFDNQNRMSYHTPRREILITDNIYGQHVGYRNDYVGSPYNNSIRSSIDTMEPTYVSRSKQVTVRNKVCDIYGKIHDIETMSGEVQATGVLMGKLQNSPNSPSNFKRGTRLTSSNNDMFQRRENYPYYAPQTQPNKSSQGTIIKGAPGRPLPPLPPTGKTVPKDSKQSISKRSSSNSSKKKKK